MANFDEREDSQTTVSPARLRALASPRAETPTIPADLGPRDRRRAPGWVVAYLVLCGALTIIGLVILALERRILGHGAP